MVGEARACTDIGGADRRSGSGVEDYPGTSENVHSSIMTASSFSSPAITMAPPFELTATFPKKRLRRMTNLLFVM